jgi:hypothetical protein
MSYSVIYIQIIGQFVINEVSDTGTTIGCGNGVDWVECRNIGQSSLQTNGYSIYLSTNSSNRFIFPPFNYGANSVGVICFFDGLPFSIGTGDNVTLADPDGMVISTTGPIPIGTSPSRTFSRDDSGVYRIAPATRSRQNVFDTIAPTKVC